MGSDIHLEAGQAAQATPRAGAFFHSFSSLSILRQLKVLTAVCEEEVGSVETHEMDILGPHTNSAASSLQSVSTGQDINEAQSVVSRAEGATSICPCCLSHPELIIFVLLLCLIGSGGIDISEMNIDQSHGGGDVNDRLGQAEAQTRAYLLFRHDCRDLNDLMDTKSAAASNPTVDHGPRDATSDPDQQPEEPRTIGDFDGSASKFWKLFRNEAKSHDDTRINTLKECMDSALIFVRSYSVSAIRTWLC
jgi:hypothetical protein